MTCAYAARLPSNPAPPACCCLATFCPRAGRPIELLIPMAVEANRLSRFSIFKFAEPQGTFRVPHIEQGIWSVQSKRALQIAMAANPNTKGLESKGSLARADGDIGTKDESDISEEKSDTYSEDMSNAMGTVLTYRHELGMNYNFVLPDLIVGSCLQTPADVNRLKSIGVRTVFCLQQDPDLEYFGVDISAIQERAKEIGGIEHIRAQIRDFDPFDLRMRLPAVIATLYKAVQRNQGITYIHCTAGLGRAPAVALTYMYWILEYNLLEANALLLSVRPCFPKLESIKNATCDLLTGVAKETVHLKWPSSSCQSVEISGLDVGWGQRLPLTLSPSKEHWTLSCELPVGKYEYKYVIDGAWVTNPAEPLTHPNKDGHVNNYVEVVGEHADPETKKLRQRLMQDDPYLTEIERKVIRRKLLAFDPLTFDLV